MLNENIKHYITEKLSIGYRPDKVKNALLKWGYNKNDVEDAFSSFEFSGSAATLPGLRKKIFFEFFTNYIHFFEDSSNFNLKKAFKHFFYAYAIFFFAQILITLGSYFFKKPEGSLPVLILTNASLSTLFFGFVLFVAAFLSMIYFILFNYLLKLQVKFSMLFAALLISLVPYLAICSIKGTFAYSIIALAWVSFGVIDINIWFLLSLLLFSFGMSKEFGLSFSKCNLYVFAGFFVFLAAVVAVFYSAVRLDILWLSFQKF